MGEILGIGVTHFPGLMLPDGYMSTFLDRTLKSERVPAELKDPARWPEPMQRELAQNRDGAAAASSPASARRARRWTRSRPTSS